jgi:hypothetical protein
VLPRLRRRNVTHSRLSTFEQTPTNLLRYIVFGEDLIRISVCLGLLFLTVCRARAHNCAVLSFRHYLAPFAHVVRIQGKSRKKNSC